ncbi:MAG: PP2C family protein-serine/threonine phosphatase [Pseudomonadota bacterium]
MFPDLIRRFSEAGDDAAFDALWRRLAENTRAVILLFREGDADDRYFILGARGEFEWTFMGVAPSERCVPYALKAASAILPTGHEPLVLDADSFLRPLNLPAAASTTVLPLWLDGQCRHWLLLRGDQPLSASQASAYAVMAGLFFAHRARAAAVAELVDARRWISSELAEIANAQRALQPDAGLSISGLEIAVLFQPMEQAGGDYYDLVPLEGVPGTQGPDGWCPAWGVMVADATGHGPAAAVETAMLDAILRTYRGAGDEGPAGVLTYANRHLFTRAIRGKLISAFVAGYAPAFKSLLYACAGHPPALVKRVSGVVEWLDDAQDIPLMVTAEHRWQSHEALLHQGDILVLYTDGVIEARSPAGDEFGMERLREMTAVAGSTARAVVDTVETALLDHRCAVPAKDDVTVVALRVVADR